MVSDSVTGIRTDRMEQQLRTRSGLRARRRLAGLSWEKRRPGGRLVLRAGVFGFIARPLAANDSSVLPHHCLPLRFVFAGTCTFAAACRQGRGGRRRRPWHRRISHWRVRSRGCYECDWAPRLARRAVYAVAQQSAEAVLFGAAPAEVGHLVRAGRSDSGEQVRVHSQSRLSDGNAVSDRKAASVGDDTRRGGGPTRDGDAF